ncbi:MAG: hypothetical protein R3F14_01170 [Polyangiaceae bacterium]
MDEAPDFWSVRAVERVLSPDRVQSSPFESYRGPAPAVEPVRAPVVDTDLQQRLSLIAREQSTNPLGAAHMSRATAEELLEGGQIDLAASLVEKSLVATTGFADPVRGDLAILRARIDIHRGRTREALASVEGVLGDPLARGDQKASALLVRGELREATGDLGGAETDYLEARDLARGTGDGAGAVRALVGLGRVTGETRGYDSEAIATLEEALSLATKLGDPGLVQSARETLAQAHRMAFDQRAADRLLSSGGTDARAPDSEK